MVETKHRHFRAGNAKVARIIWKSFNDDSLVVTKEVARKVGLSVSGARLSMREIGLQIARGRIPTPPNWEFMEIPGFRTDDEIKERCRKFALRFYRKPPYTIDKLDAKQKELREELGIRDYEDYDR